MKQAIALLLTGLAIAAVAGCTTPTQKQAKADAYNRWYETRAKVLLGVGQEQFKVGDLATARNSAREALSLVPDLLPAQILAAKVELEDGNYAESLKYLDEADKHGETADTVYLRAQVFERRRQYSDALTLYEKARALEPRNPAYVMASAETLAAMGKPQEGLDLIESKMDQLDQAPGMHKAAAELAMLVGRADKAVQHYEVARSQQGDDVTIQEALGRAYFYAGQYDKAVLTLADLLKQDHYARCTWVYSMLGESYLALGRPREARDNFEKTTELEKNEPRNWVNLAKAALAAKDPHRAIIAAKEALALRPDQPESSMVLGYALMAEGDAKAANSFLSTAVRQHPDEAMLTCLLGCSYAVMGDQNLAREWYRKTLKLDPQNQVAQAMLKRP